MILHTTGLCLETHSLMISTLTERSGDNSSSSLSGHDSERLEEGASNQGITRGNTKEAYMVGPIDDIMTWTSVGCGNLKEKVPIHEDVGVADGCEVPPNGGCCSCAC